VDATRFDHLTRTLVTPSRRGLLLASPMSFVLDFVDTEAKKKKRKKCKPCNRCPLRRCCSCEESGQPVSCFLVAPEAPCPCPGGGTTFEPVVGTANFCQTTNACARVACPVA
jgi:hypothetical protein